MSANTLLLVYAFLAVVALIVLIAGFKLHPFVVLVAVSLALGAVAGMPLPSVVKAFQDGVGGVLGRVHDGGQGHTRSRARCKGDREQSAERM